MKIIFFQIVTTCCLLLACGQATAQQPAAERVLQTYRQELDGLRKEHPNRREMPDIQFFLFGMGDRRKMIYKDGILKDALTGGSIRTWKVKRQWIVPSEYLVELETDRNERVRIIENEQGVYVTEAKTKMALAQGKLKLPRFGGNKYAAVLRVLHHEILINIIGGKPVPNFFVYQKPWFRDAALMAMVLKQTGNLHLIRNWILSIRDPFDRNNHGIAEADNPGQVLFLLSLVSDKNNPMVQTVIDSAVQFKKGDYIEGKTDYAAHPVFQTKWLKYGLKSLGLPDPYLIPKAYDWYSSLFWWDYKSQHVDGAKFEDSNSTNYPYLVWAEDHFYGENRGIVTNRDYPLSWESHASDAHYPGLKNLDERLIQDKLSPPHTWHAAEMFLLLNQ